VITLQHRPAAWAADGATRRRYHLRGAVAAL